MDQLANVNFIGLQLNDLQNLYNINNKFKNDNKFDPKIESNLTTHMNTLIESNLMFVKYFYIRNKIIGITNPDDEEIVKKKLHKINTRL